MTITKHKDDSNVIFKYFVLVALVVNSALIFTNYQMETLWVGSVESSRYNWTTYTIQHGDQLSADIIYSIVDNHEVQEQSQYVNYRFFADNDNTLLLKNYEMTLPTRRTSYYFIDDECKLAFRGSEKMRMTNFHLFCRFNPYIAL